MAVYASFLFTCSYCFNLCFIFLVRKQLPRQRKARKWLQPSLHQRWRHEFSFCIVFPSIYSCDNSAIILKDDTVYQTNLELHRLMYVFLQSSPDFVLILLVLSSIPALNKCQIKDPELMDELLKPTYKNLPMLPRYSNLSHNLFLSDFNF